MHGHVLVALLEAVVLADVVQVVAADDDGALHLHLGHHAWGQSGGQDSDGDEETHTEQRQTGLEVWGVTHRAQGFDGAPKGIGRDKWHLTRQGSSTFSSTNFSFFAPKISPNTP